MDVSEEATKDQELDESSDDEDNVFIDPMEDEKDMYEELQAEYKEQFKMFKLTLIRLFVQKDSVSQGTIDKLDELFETIDRDRDGGISKQELGKLLNDLVVETQQSRELKDEDMRADFFVPAEIQEIMARIDTDNDGLIALPEMLEGFKFFRELLQEKGLGDIVSQVPNIDPKLHASIEKLSSRVGKFIQNIGEEIKVETEKHMEDSDEEDELEDELIEVEEKKRNDKMTK